MTDCTHIYFDLDHTLWDTDRNSEESLKELFSEMKLQELGIPSFNAFMYQYRRHNERLWGLYAENQIAKDAVRLHRFLHTLQDFGIHDSTCASTLAEEFISRTPHKTYLIEGTVALLDSLKGKYNLSVITNGFKESQHTKLQVSGIAHYFDQVFISEEIGFHKPDPQIFHHARKLTGGPECCNCIMVGDTYQTDILGAIAAGMKAVHYAPHLEKPYGDPVITIKTLADLQNLLCKPVEN